MRPDGLPRNLRDCSTTMLTALVELAKHTQDDLSRAQEFINRAPKDPGPDKKGKKREPCADDFGTAKISSDDILRAAVLFQIDGNAAEKARQEEAAKKQSVGLASKGTSAFRTTNGSTASTHPVAARASEAARSTSQRLPPPTAAATAAIEGRPPPARMPAPPSGRQQLPPTTQEHNDLLVRRQRKAKPQTQRIGVPAKTQAPHVTERGIRQWLPPQTQSAAIPANPPPTTNTEQASTAQGTAIGTSSCGILSKLASFLKWLPIIIAVVWSLLCLFVVVWGDARKEE